MSQEERVFCSDIARENHVPLMATATRGDLWFLLEYGGRFEGKAFEASTIPDEVKAYLKEVQVPGLKTRILLIRKPDPHDSVLHLFVGLTDPQNPKLYQYQLDSYTDILDIDLVKVAEGEPEDASALREDPLFLVCTNGRRDFCCARRGPAIFNALTKIVGDAVWQSSHIGGHNKAPNTLFFPYGVESGYTTPEVIGDFVHEFQEHRVNLEYYRGRVCYDAPAQAAEHFWRQETGIMDLPGMQLVSVETVSDNEWQVEVQGTDGTNRQQMRIQRRESEPQIPITCALDKLRPISSYHRVG